MLHRVPVANTSQHQMFGSVCLNHAFIVKQLQKKAEDQQEKDNCVGQKKNNKKKTNQGIDIGTVEMVFGLFLDV